MNHWFDNSVKNLLPLSEAQIFSEALREWFFTGHVIDYEHDDIQCELCEHLDLAHHFEIKNLVTENSLLVGSSCILKFKEIEIQDSNGKPITDQKEREAALKHALRQSVIESGLVPLRKLWIKDRKNRDRIERLAKILKLDQGVSPRDLLFLLTEMENNGIHYQIKTYKISLRSFEQSDFLNMNKSSALKLLPALSRVQLTKIRSLISDL